MAYQARGRDPLLDSNMAEAIEKRGKELLGLVLMCLGAMAVAMIVSYSPDDPSWMSATDAPIENLLGPIGATIAAPLFMIVGWGAWGLAIVLGVWGARFALHRGQERAIGRLIFAPIWVAVLALYASSLTPGEEWNATHNFGLGGLFGDTVLGAAAWASCRSARAFPLSCFRSCWALECSFLGPLCLVLPVSRLPGWVVSCWWASS